MLPDGDGRVDPDRDGRAEDDWLPDGAGLLAGAELAGAEVGDVMTTLAHAHTFWVVSTVPSGLKVFLTLDWQV